MPDPHEFTLIERCYERKFAAHPPVAFEQYLSHPSSEGISAALGFRRADRGPLYLETYLDEPVEAAVSRAFGNRVERGKIIEVGNLAAESAPAMLGLWSLTANDLGGDGEIVVATLTSPLRAMFARLGLKLVILAPARPERVGGDVVRWGRYYQLDPMVCAGSVVEGQAALARFAQRRGRRACA